MQGAVSLAQAWPASRQANRHQGSCVNGALALISDIHGNRWALDAVLEDIDRRGIQNIINLGDHFYGPLAPGATAERLLKLPVLATIRGNQDRQLIEPLPDIPHPTHR